MIQRPGIRVCLRPAPAFSVTGKHAKRALNFARRYLAAIGVDVEPKCNIEVADAPEDHIGLGTGTQLALSVATGLSVFLGQGEPPVEMMAVASQRGLRSSVGSHGFSLGGLLLDEGKMGDQRLAKIGDRVVLPEDWRWVLIRPRSGIGLSGASEQRAFHELPPVPVSKTDALLEEVQERLFPAARAADVELFGESLYRYGVMAGKCFAPRQAGAFATEEIQQIVDHCRKLGVRGVGQSSWGPTVFTLFDNDIAAGEFLLQFRAEPCHQDLQCTLAEPDNQGVQVSVKKRSDRTVNY